MANTGQAISGIVGGLIGGTIGFFLGGPAGAAAGALKGAMYGGTLGLIMGSILFPTTVDVPDAQRPTPSGICVTSSSYGLPIPVVFGTRKIGGNILYYGNFQTISHVHYQESPGGKGGGGGGSTTTTITYTYTVSLAIGLCMGEMTVSKCWAGKNLVPSSSYIVYPGTQTAPDSHIQACMAAEGKTRFPVWKNLCYVVLPNFDLGESPNVPNFMFEVGHYSSGWDSWTHLLLKMEGTDKDYVYSEAQYYKPVWRDSSVDHHTLFSINPWWSLPSLERCPYIDGSTKKFGRSSGNFGYERHLTAYGWPYTFGILPASLQPLTSDFTIDCWIYWDTLPHHTGPYNDLFPVYSGNKTGWWSSGEWFTFGVSEQGISYQYQLYFYYYKDGDLLQITSPTLTAPLVDEPVAKTWYHVAVVRSTYKIYLFWNGKCVKTYESWKHNDPPEDPEEPYEEWTPYTIPIPATQWTNIEAFIQIGGAGYCGGAMTMNLDELRYSNIARWTADFIPPKMEYLLSDVPPAWMTSHILTNDLYGCGLDDAVLNHTSFDDTDAYCVDHEMFVSMVFDRQMSILDILQHIISHHNGYIVYYNGQLHYHQLKSETAVADYTDDYIVKEGEDYPVQLVKRGIKDCSNKVVVEYSKRDNDYNTGTVTVENSIDITNFGLNTKTLKLDGLTTFQRAQYLAMFILMYDSFNPCSVIFKAGIKSLGIKPGDVITYTNEALELDHAPLRIMNIRENSDFVIEIEAREDGDIYDLINYGTDSSTSTDVPQLYASCGTVVNEVFVEISSLYVTKCVLGVSSSKPNEVQWNGASLYQSYSSGGHFEKIKMASFSGVTGTVIGVGTDSDDDKYIDVQLSYDYTFSSASDFDTFIITAKYNLFICQGAYGDVYCRFQNCDLISSLKWRLSKLIYDCTGNSILNSYGVISKDDKFYLYANVQFLHTLSASDKHRTLYFKIASYNFKGEEQNLADVDQKSKAIEALVDKPLSPCSMVVNSFGVGDSNMITVEDGQLDFSFHSRNRFASNFNTYNVDVADDLDFKEFQIYIWKDDDTLLRSIYQSSKSYSYTLAEQIADGGPFSTYKVGIIQKNLSESSDMYLVTINTV